ncbi:MAG: MFS transporter [Dehalococcoidia bacterium]|nr:MFS transporter [Dehalococcoidia bacterium]
MRGITVTKGVFPIPRVQAVFYGWWLVGESFFLMTLMSLAIFQGLGAFLVSMEEQFGWSRGVISGAFAITYVESAFLSPIVGHLVDRFGPRRLVLVGYLCMAGGFFLFSQVHSLWQFYLAFLVINLGAEVGGWLPLIAAVNNWFQRHRTLAMSITMSSINFGGILVPLLVLGLDSHGFRWTTAGIGAFLLLIAAPAYIFIRNRPEDYGLERDGGAVAPASTTASVSKTPVHEAEVEFTVGAALRTKAFWILTIAGIASGVPLMALGVHLFPKLTDMGLSDGTAGLVILVFTAVALPANLIGGFLGDRFRKEPLIAGFLVLQCLAILLLALSDGSFSAWLFAALYGVAFGTRLGMSTAIWADYFGRSRFASIYAWSFVPTNLGIVAGPLFAGFLFDLRGSYAIPFTVFAGLSLVGAAAMLLCKRPVLKLASRHPLPTT